MLTRGNNMGTKKNQLEKLDKTNESQTGKIGDNGERNYNTPKETGSNVSIEKATNSAGLSNKRKRSTENVDGGSNKLSRSSRSTLDKQKRSLDEDEDGEKVNTKKLRTSNHIIDDASYDADSEGSSSGSHLACNTIGMPIEGTVEPPVLQEELSASHVRNVMAWNCDPTIPISYYWDRFGDSSTVLNPSIASMEDTEIINLVSDDDEIITISSDEDDDNNGNNDNDENDDNNENDENDDDNENDEEYVKKIFL